MEWWSSRFLSIAQATIIPEPAISSSCRTVPASRYALRITLHPGGTHIQDYHRTAHHTYATAHIPLPPVARGQRLQTLPLASRYRMAYQAASATLRGVGSLLSGRAYLRCHHRPGRSGPG